MVICAPSYPGWAIGVARAAYVSPGWAIRSSVISYTCFPWLELTRD